MSGNAFGQRLCYLFLWHGIPCFGPVFGDQGDGIIQPAHNTGFGTDIIGDDPVTALFLPFGGCMRQNIFCLRRKANDKAWPLRAGAGNAC